MILINFAIEYLFDDIHSEIICIIIINDVTVPFFLGRYVFFSSASFIIHFFISAYYCCFLLY
ncbi:hypothetical protein CW304_05690 [Bacillus sp. UFRGS-B20]|nr:hypothetical protein CW304_05690 [Bacillus sp. UFRGS-B20]